MQRAVGKEVIHIRQLLLNTISELGDERGQQGCGQCARTLAEGCQFVHQSGANGITCTAAAQHRLSVIGWE